MWLNGGASGFAYLEDSESGPEVEDRTGCGAGTEYLATALPLNADAALHEPSSYLVRSIAEVCKCCDVRTAYSRTPRSPSSLARPLHHHMQTPLFHSTSHYTAELCRIAFFLARWRQLRVQSRNIGVKVRFEVTGT